MNSTEKRKRQYVDVTPAVATRYLAMNWGGQRKVQEYFVDILGRSMMKGMMLDETLRIAVIKDRDSVPEEYRESMNGALMFDGQHRCLASRKYGATFPAIVVTHYCDNWAEFLSLNEHTDQGRMRAEPDMNNYRLDAMGKKGVWPKGAMAGIKSALIWKSGIHPKEMSKVERLDLLEKNMVVVKKAMNILLGIPQKQVKFLTRKAVMAAMLDTIIVAPNVAGTFWHKIGSLDNVGSDSPEWTLGTWLTTVRMRHGLETQKAYLKIIRAWNKAHPEYRITVKYLSNGKSARPQYYPQALQEDSIA